MSILTIINESAEVPRVAIYKKPQAHPSLNSVAWKTVAPPPLGGEAKVTVPDDFEIYAQYSNNPMTPDDTQYTTNRIDFSELTAGFKVSSVVSQDKRADAAEITQDFTNLVLNEVQVLNDYGIGVIGHILKEGTDIYPPQVIWPGGVLIEDVRSPLYLAVVSDFTYRGDALVDRELSLTETEILEGQTAVVTGSIWTGWSIKVL